MAVRLPYGVQAFLAVIQPGRIVTVDIKPAADAMMAAMARDAGDLFSDDHGTSTWATSRPGSA